MLLPLFFHGLWWWFSVYLCFCVLIFLCCKINPSRVNKRKHQIIHLHSIISRLLNSSKVEHLHKHNMTQSWKAITIIYVLSAPNSENRDGGMLRWVGMVMGSGDWNVERKDQGYASRKQRLAAGHYFRYSTFFRKNVQVLPSKCLRKLSFNPFLLLSFFKDWMEFETKPFYF